MSVPGLSGESGHFPDPELSPELAASSPSLLQTLQKKVSVVSVAEITFDRSVYAQLPGQEASLRAQMEMVLEEYEVYDPLPLVVGSCVGGLLLLALITATLFKLGFFKRRYKEMMGDKPEDAAMFSGEAPNLPLS
uniref:Integrin subunit alpha D n=1 Tax=Myotis myotis TaxID=51298 RepID=A0A7J7XZU0_MYOMY|nr:integrin subunit alpha D [Myotis myotis]